MCTYVRIHTLNVPCSTTKSSPKTKEINKALTKDITGEVWGELLYYKDKKHEITISGPHVTHPVVLPLQGYSGFSTF